MEYIEIKYLKNLGIYSLIMGGACGLISVIPFFTPFLSLFFLPFLGCAIPLAVLCYRDNFYSKDNKTYTILGGYSGLCIASAWVFVFVPIAYILHFIFKNYYFGNVVQYLNLFLFAMFFVMIALVYIITNSVTGLLLGIGYKYFKENQNGKDNRMDKE